MLLVPYLPASCFYVTLSLISYAVSSFMLVDLVLSIVHSIFLSQLHRYLPILQPIHLIPSMSVQPILLISSETLRMRLNGYGEIRPFLCELGENDGKEGEDPAFLLLCRNNINL